MTVSSRKNGGTPFEHDTVALNPEGFFASPRCRPSGLFPSVQARGDLCVQCLLIKKHRPLPRVCQGCTATGSGSVSGNPTYLDLALIISAARQAARAAEISGAEPPAAFRTSDEQETQDDDKRIGEYRKYPCEYNCNDTILNCPRRIGKKTEKNGCHADDGDGH